MHMHMKLIIIALVIFMFTSRESFTPAVIADPTKARCRKFAAKSLWSKYHWKSRRNFGTDEAPVLKCPRGWENTGCLKGLGHGKEFENKQCRMKKPVAAAVVPAVVPAVVDTVVDTVAPAVVDTVVPAVEELPAAALDHAFDLNNVIPLP